MSVHLEARRPHQATRIVAGQISSCAVTGWTSSLTVTLRLISHLRMRTQGLDATKMIVYKRNESPMELSSVDMTLALDLSGQQEVASSCPSRSR